MTQSSDVERVAFRVRLPDTGISDLVRGYSATGGFVGPE